MSSLLKFNNLSLLYIVKNLDEPDPNRIERFSQSICRIEFNNKWWKVASLIWRYKYIAHPSTNMSGRFCEPPLGPSPWMDKLVVSQLLRTRWLGGQVHGHPGLDRVPYSWPARAPLWPPRPWSGQVLPPFHPAPGPHPRSRWLQKLQNLTTLFTWANLNCPYSLEISHSCHLFAISSVPRFDAAQMDFRVKNSKWANSSLLLLTIEVCGHQNREFRGFWENRVFLT